MKSWRPTPMVWLTTTPPWTTRWSTSLQVWPGSAVAPQRAGRIAGQARALVADEGRDLQRRARTEVVEPGQRAEEIALVLGRVGAVGDEVGRMRCRTDRLRASRRAGRPRAAAASDRWGSDSGSRRRRPAAAGDRCRPGDRRRSGRRARRAGDRAGSGSGPAGRGRARWCRGCRRRRPTAVRTGRRRRPALRPRCRSRRRAAAARRAAGPGVASGCRPRRRRSRQLGRQPADDDVGALDDLAVQQLLQPVLHRRRQGDVVDAQREAGEAPADVDGAVVVARDPRLGGDRRR